MNKTFYIKYGDSLQVKIDTLIDSSRKRREFPLEDVDDLISAFQTIPNSPIASAFVGNITLHYTADGEAIKGNKKLSTIVCSEKEEDSEEDGQSTSKVTSSLKKVKLNIEPVSNNNPLILRNNSPNQMQTQGIYYSITKYNSNESTRCYCNAN